DRFPKIHEDESWQAAPGYTFWAEGHFGTDLFAGFYGMETNYYGFMPLFPIMVGSALHLFGVGLFQARLVPLVLITLALALTHRLGTKLFSPWHGALAVIILVSWRIAGPFPHLVTGIPLVDVARIVRYDSAVPLFGLAALLGLIWILKRSGKAGAWMFEKPWLLTFGWPYLMLGSLIGLATVSHLYGAFWLPVTAVLLLWMFGWRSIGLGIWIGAGFLLVLAPWLIFVASGWEDFVNQNRNYSDRFGLLDVQFYQINLLNEVERYDPILNGAKQSLGAWVWLIVCGVTLCWLSWQAFYGKLEGISNYPLPRWPVRIVITAIVVIGSLFGLLLSFKTFSYLATLWPLFALVIAVGFIYAWQMPTNYRWWRPVLVFIFILPVFEGAFTIYQTHQIAKRTTPYEQFMHTVSDKLPPDSHVLGLQHYWLGLTEQSDDYRSILVPLFWTDARYVPQPRPFAVSADLIPPNIILLDQIMLDFLSLTDNPQDQLHPVNLELRAYLLDNRAKLIGELEDPTYGRVEIYELELEP
ncbi:MAG: hypothetical protein AAF485_21475, partial [Chloroflexota bacterium]